MSELLINLRNHAREEREVPSDIEVVREQMGEYGALLAARELVRAEALQRLTEKARTDGTLADLLIVIGVVL